MTCAEIVEQTVDFLYGDLAAPARRAFEQHLAGCAACRAEVEGLAAARGQARTALRGTLAEEPPAGVRARVLAAAAAAAAERSPAADRSPSAAPVSSPPAVRPVRSARAPEPTGLWAWLRRPWVLPAFAAASVMAVFVLARQVIVDPEKRALAPAPSAESAPSVREAPAFAPPPTSPAKDGLVRAQASVEDKDVGKARARAELAKIPRRVATNSPPAAAAPRPAAPAQAEARWAEPPPPASAPARNQALVERSRARALADDPLDEIGLAGPSGGTPTGPPQKKASAPSAGAGAFGGAIGSLASRGGQERDVRPSARMKAKAEQVEDESGSGAVAHAARSLDRYETADAVSKGRSAAAPAEKAAAPAAKAAAPSLDQLIARAGAAFKASRWTEAAAAYKELVRRFPDHKDLATWKRRQVEAERAAHP